MELDLERDVASRLLVLGVMESERKIPHAAIADAQDRRRGFADESQLVRSAWLLLVKHGDFHHSGAHVNLGRNLKLLVLTLPEGVLAALVVGLSALRLVCDLELAEGVHRRQQPRVLGEGTLEARYYQSANCSHD